MNIYMASNPEDVCFSIEFYEKFTNDYLMAISTLNDIEYSVYVLREMNLSYKEIKLFHKIKSNANLRKIYSRARNKVYNYLHEKLKIDAREMLRIIDEDVKEDYYAPIKRGMIDDETI